MRNTVILTMALAAMLRFAGLGLVCESNAATIYVKSASGAVQRPPLLPQLDPGSLDLPYRTVTEAYTAAASGDTIIVAADGYPERITFNKPVTLRGACGTVAIGPLGDSGPQDFELTTSTVSIDSSGSLFAEWNDVTANSLGVAAEDPVSKEIGIYPCLAPGRPGGPWTPLGNWLLAGRVKQTLCGTLTAFSVHEDGDEVDWNLDIVPSARYAYVFDDVLAEVPGVDRTEWGCGSRTRCMQAEVTPDQALYDFPWFNKNTGTSRLLGKCVGVYGPWVTDDGDSHGRKPEIHPCELIWWRDSEECEAPNPLSGGVYLLVVQDDSNRFDRASDYDTSGSPDLCWRPWSAYPRTGRFKLAFRVNTLAATPQEVHISVMENRNVNLNLHDATAGTDHALVYNGRRLLNVRELDGDGFVEVGFEGCFRRTEAEGEVLYGFVTLTSSVGKGDRGDEGYLLIYVTH